MTHYPFPRASDVRRVFDWATVPTEITVPSIERTAYHEAGHVVLLEWAGLDVKHAIISQDNGFTLFDTPAAPQGASDTPTAPEHLAGLASICHAGICAELIHTGLVWNGIVRRNDADWRMSDEILRPTFGSSSSGHGYAQRVALAVLTERWDRVTEVARGIVANGSWHA